MRKVVRLAVHTAKGFEKAPGVPAAVSLARSLVSSCTEVAQGDDLARVAGLVGLCVAQNASMSADLRLRAAQSRVDRFLARADRRWEELRSLAQTAGAWSQAQGAPMMESCIEDLASIAVEMNRLNELVWDARPLSEREAVADCTAITGAAAQQLVLASTIALKVGRDAGVNLSSSVTHARYRFDTLCSVGTACIRAYVDRAFPEPMVLGTRLGFCRIHCEAPSREEYFTSDEVPANASLVNPLFADAMSAANSARRKKVSAEADVRVATSGLTTMWAAARSLSERRGPHRAPPRAP